MDNAVRLDLQVWQRPQAVARDTTRHASKRGWRGGRGASFSSKGVARRGNVPRCDHVHRGRNCSSHDESTRTCSTPLPTGTVHSHVAPHMTPCGFEHALGHHTMLSSVPAWLPVQWKMHLSRASQASPRVRCLWVSPSSVCRRRLATRATCLRACAHHVHTRQFLSRRRVPPACTTGKVRPPVILKTTGDDSRALRFSGTGRNTVQRRRRPTTVASIACYRGRAAAGGSRYVAAYPLAATHVGCVKK